MYRVKDAVQNLIEYTDARTLAGMLRDLDKSPTWLSVTPEASFADAAVAVYAEGGDAAIAMHGFVSVVRTIADYEGDLMEDILLAAGVAGRIPRYLVAREVLLLAERASSPEKSAIHRMAMAFMSERKFPESLDAPIPSTIADLIVIGKWAEAESMLSALRPVAPTLSAQIAHAMSDPEALMERVVSSLN